MGCRNGDWRLFVYPYSMVSHCFLIWRPKFGSEHMVGENMQQYTSHPPHLHCYTRWWRSDKLDTAGSSAFECPLANEQMSLAECTLGYEMYSEDWTQCKPGLEEGDAVTGDITEPKSKIINWIQTSIATLKKLKKRKQQKQEESAKVENDKQEL